MRTQSGAIQNWRRKNKYSLDIEEGVLMSVTEVFKTTPLFSEQVPYWIGLIEVNPSPLAVARTLPLAGEGKVVKNFIIVGQLVKVKGWAPKIGDRVRATRRILYRDGDEGVVQYGIKWRLC